MDYIQNLLRRHRRIALALHTEPMMVPASVTDAQRAEGDLRKEPASPASERARLAAEHLYEELLQAQQTPSGAANSGARMLQERLFTQTQAIPQQIHTVSEQMQTMQERLMETVREAGLMQLAQSASSQVSMEDISRYFERDARRYGG